MTDLTKLDRQTYILSWLKILQEVQDLPSLCSEIEVSATKAVMDPDDPWHWPVDRVVRELCTSNRSWRPHSASMGAPPPGPLESALRENVVSGSVLLLYVTDSLMQETLGLSALGHRAFIQNAIAELKLMSSEYRAHEAKNHSPSIQASLVSPSVNRVIYDKVQFGHGLDPLLGAHLPQPGAHLTAERIAAFARLGAYSSVPPQQLMPGISSLIAHSEDDQPDRDGYVVDDHMGNKRRKTNSRTMSNHIEPQADSHPEGAHALTQPADPPADGILTPAPVPILEPEVNCGGKKRKRIAPTLITSEIDPDRDRVVPTAADSVLRHDPANVEPGVPFVGDDGNKRVVPIRQLDVTSGEHYDVEDSRNSHTVTQGAPHQSPAAISCRRRSLRNGRNTQSRDYLGKCKLSVDKVFYEETPVGGMLPDDVTERVFYNGDSKLPSGRRLYVHHLMKNMLLARPQVLQKAGQTFIAVRPYSSSLIPKNQSPSFTLYYTGTDRTVYGRREDLRSWPQVDPEAVSHEPEDIDDEKRVVFNPLGPEMLHGIDSYRDWDPSYLEKYRYIKGGDEVLPLYGYSDEDNEYDEETWREMEAERGSLLERPKGKVKKPRLDVTEVMKLIDECIVEMALKWKETKLPLRQYKAAKFWKTFAPARKDKVKKARREITHLDERIGKLRKEIAGEIWTSQLQVRKQARILEVSIFDREDLKWQTCVLQSDTPPDKIARPALAKVKKCSDHIDDGEEGESIDSDSESLNSDDDGLENFVVDDDENSVDELLELNLADSEADDASSSDDNLIEQAEEGPPGNTKERAASKLLNSGAHQDSSPLIGLLVEDGGNRALSRTSRIARIKAEQEFSRLPSSSTPASLEMIDLTMTSSDESPEIINLMTPRKNSTLDRNIHQPSSCRTPEKTSKKAETMPVNADNRPSCYNPSAIAQRGNQFWENLQDRDRLLISVVHSMDDVTRAIVFSAVDNISRRELWFFLHRQLEAYAGICQMEGMEHENFEAMAHLARLFEIYVDCKYYRWGEIPLPKAAGALLDAHTVWLEKFRDCICKLESYFEKQGAEEQLQPDKGASGLSASASDEEEEEEDDDEDPRSAVKRQARLNGVSDDDMTVTDTPHKTRKKKIFEDAEARDLREQDRQRQAELETRRKKLQEELAKRPAGMDDHSQIIINETKLDDHGFIYVNGHIAQRIKKHQIEGVRFMWNQIVTDQKAMQGCLLAHTMGLGKTMQVITLLVAIAEAAKSIDPRISSQVPQSLRVSKTLVLCPPGLIDNWMDELLTWAPENLLGDFRKVDSSADIVQRLRTIARWNDGGGVLLIGYEMFRKFVKNKKSRNGSAALSDEQHDEVRRQLLDGPNIIIADEAHKMKNASAAITIAASQLRSRSRIALTGSPLANNVEEYHTMIEWVAPNYLGPAVEFRAKYVEPIQQGLWVESSSYERRKSLKMLGVLKEDLAPKVHRADMSVLRDDLPPKKEFVITIPLTELQKEAYTLYVRSMLSGSKEMTKDGDIQQTTIWHWLAVLSLLCNHPSCFNAKLNERKEDARKGMSQIEEILGSRGASDEDEAIAQDLNAPIWKIGVSHELITTETELFRSKTVDLGSIELSNKTKVLSQILDASKATGDKVLVFSQSLPTLDFLETMCKDQGRKIARLDGSTKMSKRQGMTKAFNNGNTEVYLISTTAGGLGLNLPAANRVVIFDFKFNPIMEEQAIGRAYRIGQKKPVFVYRFVVGGTFEDAVHNKAVFKTQLASRVVDKKNPIAWAKKKIGEFLFEPKPVEQKDLSEFRDMDPKVLDVILASQVKENTIRAIVQSDTFERDDDDRLTAEEQKEVKQLLSDEKLKRSNPKAWKLKQAQMQYQEPRPQARQGDTILSPEPVPPSLVSTPSVSRGVVGQGALPSSSPQSRSLENGARFAENSPQINASSAPRRQGNVDSLGQNSGAFMQPVPASGKVLTSPPDPAAAASKSMVRVWTSGATSMPATGNGVKAASKNSMPSPITVASSHKGESSTASTNNLGFISNKGIIVFTDKARKRLETALIETARRSHISSKILTEDVLKKFRDRIDEVNDAFRRHAQKGGDSQKAIVAAAIAIETNDPRGMKVLNSKISPDEFVNTFITELAETPVSVHNEQTESGKVRASHTVPSSSASDIGSNTDTLCKKQTISDLNPRKGSSEAEIPITRAGLRQPFRDFDLWHRDELQAYLIRHGLSTEGSREEIIARCMLRSQKPRHKDSGHGEAPISQIAKQEAMDVSASAATEVLAYPAVQIYKLEAVAQGVPVATDSPASPVCAASGSASRLGGSTFKRIAQTLGFGQS